MLEQVVGIFPDERLYYATIAPCFQAMQWAMTSEFIVS